MKHYSESASTKKRWLYAHFVIAAVESEEKTAHLAKPLEELNDEMWDKMLETQNLEPAIRRAAALVVRSERKLDKKLAALAKQAEIADDRRDGPLKKVLFPDGVTAVTINTRQKQVDAGNEVLKRLTTSKREGMDKLATQASAELTQAIELHQTNVNKLKAAKKAHRASFLDELELRDQHMLLIDRMMGAIRDLYPKNRPMQDSFFPKMHRKSSKKNTPEDDDFDDGDK